MYKSFNLHTERLLLRPASIEDAPDLLAYHLRNRAHFQAWEPLRSDAFFTQAAQVERLAEMLKQMQAETSVYLLMFARHNLALIGTCAFTNIMRGPFQACHLGYGISEDCQGHGLMQEALSSALPYMFEHYELHRIMASYRPENKRSARLLARLGFEIEGIARRYLKINGEWADHILTSKINSTD